MMLRMLITPVAAITAALTPGGASAQQFDPDMAWPLCGRITEDPGESWHPVTAPDCPAYRFGDPAYSDLPINSTFGPRPLASEGGRYDFHRGIDIATPVGTPVFAIADGIVRHAGPHTGYSDPVIIVRHYRPGETTCSTAGCYHANYLHMSGWLDFATNEPVVKGQLLGYTGESESGFDHLHFEIRDARPEDPFSSWQRDAIHPLIVLPHADAAPVAVSVGAFDQTDPANPVVEVTVTTTRADLAAVDVTLFDGSGAAIAQPGDAPDLFGYNVEPAFFDFEVWNRQYTHKDSSAAPWESFGAGGENQCPYHGDHPSSYTAHVHMDRAASDDDRIGAFNGVRIDPPVFSSGVYQLTVTFEALTGPAACGEAVATMTNGDTAIAAFGDCSPPTNAAPIAHDLALDGSEDVPLAIELTGEDADGDPLTYSVVTQPSHGALSGAGASRTYAPDADYFGADSFEFVANDGQEDSPRALVSLTIAPANDPPTAEPQSVTTIRNTSVDIALSGSDVDGDDLDFAIVSAPDHGSLSGAGASLNYTPEENYTGQDAFVFSVSDGAGGYAEASVSISVKKGKGGKGGGGKGKPN